MGNIGIGIRRTKWHQHHCMCGAMSGHGSTCTFFNHIHRHAHILSPEHVCVGLSTTSVVASILSRYLYIIHSAKAAEKTKIWKIVFTVRNRQTINLQTSRLYPPTHLWWQLGQVISWTQSPYPDLSTTFSQTSKLSIFLTSSVMSGRNGTLGSRLWWRITGMLERESQPKKNPLFQTRATFERGQWQASGYLRIYGIKDDSWRFPVDPLVELVVQRLSNTSLISTLFDKIINEPISIPCKPWADILHGTQSVNGLASDYRLKHFEQGTPSHLNL